LILTELALTLGTWGTVPPTTEAMLNTSRALAKWAKRSDIDLRLEVYGSWQRDRDTLAGLLELQREGYPLTPVLRLNPRSDLLQDAAAQGVRNVVFEVPVSREIAGMRYLPAGIERAIEVAATTARDAALAGLTPEIALVDIARSDRRSITALVEAVEEQTRARRVTPRYRLVDPAGFASPLPGSRLPRSLAAWVRFFQRELSISSERLAVQAADTRGLALANLLAACGDGAQPATSLFGLGHGTGWAATEAALAHLKTDIDLRGLVRLRDAIVTPGHRDGHRPFSGKRAWETPADTTPEALDTKVVELYGFSPKKRFGIDPPPLLTSLSGHAGLLHLLHRNNPERHFESDDPRSLEISKGFEAEFAAGRHQPVSWEELEPRVRETGLLDAPDDEIVE